VDGCQEQPVLSTLPDPSSGRMLRGSIVAMTLRPNRPPPPVDECQELALFSMLPDPSSGRMLRNTW
jgi:hypothetical protein